MASTLGYSQNITPKEFRHRFTTSILRRGLLLQSQ